mmetsp:Transcript_18737/g.21534  ORF Transcript_18737/g.21534 Transcript_18737/m.21534 type:complete len:86 (+) Transcript_18737:14-271(+)
MSGEEGFPIFVKTISGNSLVMDVTKETTVAELKTMIVDKGEVEVSADMSLFYAGKVLKDGKLIDFEVHKNSTIHLVVRMLGGEDA